MEVGGPYGGPEERKIQENPTDFFGRGHLAWGLEMLSITLET